MDSIVELTQELIRAPSRAGRDSYDAVVAAMAAWLERNGVDCTRLEDADGRTVALTGATRARAGPLYLLDATLDTAPFGDRRKWRDAPQSAVIRDGWLYGRGAADSKVGAALFAHLVAAFAKENELLSGRLAYLFDLDEHTGAFSGIKRYLEANPHGRAPSGAFIGYSGNERIVIGGRGFARARVVVHGVAAHSGSHSHPGVNAIARAARLVAHLERWQPPDNGADFPLPPKVTVTTIRGGEGFSVVPDRCGLDIDVRLTPSFGADDAHEMLARALAHALPPEGDVAPSAIEWLPDSWPAYRIDEDAPIVRALRDAARAAFDRDVPAAVAGPSNIGNYLAQRGIPAIAGFGVTSRNIHGSDERIEIASIAPVWTAYGTALARLLR